MVAIETLSCSSKASQKTFDQIKKSFGWEQTNKDQKGNKKIREFTKEKK